MVKNQVLTPKTLADPALAPVFALAAALRGIRPLQEQAVAVPDQTLQGWNVRAAVRNCVPVEKLLGYAETTDLHVALTRAAGLDPRATAELIAVRFDELGDAIQS